MKKVSSVKDLQHLRDSLRGIYNAQVKKVFVCAGTGCVAGGSLEIYSNLIEISNSKGLTVKIELDKSEANSIGITKSGCHGFCEMGPLVRIEPGSLLYTKVKIQDCEDIVEKTLMKNEILEHLLYEFEDKKYEDQEEIPFYKRQKRIVLEECGQLNAESVREYLAIGGYTALQKAVEDMTSDSIIDEILKANLRGRGGGGFPAGRKWKQVKSQTEKKRYIVCNGDEGDPGAFMDRSIMEGNPHLLIEGMLIAAIACEADEGYIYVRSEYPLAVERLRLAIEKATDLGLLGENILGSGRNFILHINKGAGAFVCGEGSALTASIEGKRGMPRVKPPRTVEAGLFGKPTVLNNVETFANIPSIINKGYEWFLKIGVPESPGTKAFAITGNIRNTGLIEVPMGTSLREVIFDIGGGIKDGKSFKAVQIGGPSGGCLVEEHLDLPLDFDSLKRVGAMVGSGGLVVMDDSTCMVEVARFFMNFTQNESCGKCVPCREGTKRMLEILDRIVEGRGKIEDLDVLAELAETISDTSLCGLGKSAPGPVISTLKYFREEYLEHIVEKKCSTKNCAALRRIFIVPEKCKGCTKCARICPVEAISGKVKEKFVIDQDKCIKCGACLESCAFGAIEEE